VAENLLTLVGKLTEREKQDIAFVWDCPCDPAHLGLQDRQKTIQLLLEASRFFRGTFATTAAILQAGRAIGSAS
jgi:hypothetical protein